MLSEEATAALEALERDPKLAPIAKILRNEFHAMEDAFQALSKPVKKAVEKTVKQAIAPAPAQRLREVLVWKRGSSFSIRGANTDASWLEDLYTSPPKSFLFRLHKDRNPTATDVGAALEAGNAVRMNFVPLAIDAMPGDLVVSNPRPRNFGGHSGRELVATFAFLTIDILPDPTADPEDFDPAPAATSHEDAPKSHSRGFVTDEVRKAVQQAVQAHGAKVPQPLVDAIAETFLLTGAEVEREIRIAANA